MILYKSKNSDTNQDGKVSFEEFKAMMNKLGTVYILGQ